MHGQGGITMRKIIGFIVTAGHLDIEWYQPLRSYRFWTVEALEDLKRISQTRDDFKTYCLDGQYYPLKEYLGVVPEDEAAMRALVEKGLLTIGPFFTQFDEWLPSAESMIRNCLYGERLCKKFGGYMQAGYLPDGEKTYSGGCPAGTGMLFGALVGAGGGGRIGKPTGGGFCGGAGWRTRRLRGASFCHG